MSQLKRPAHNPIILAAASLALPLALHQQRLKVKVSPNCVSAVRRLHDSHAVVLMNHSDRDDPLTAFALSRACHEDFYYLAARELFDPGFGIRGWLMQNSGAYSVVRGQPEDLESKELTISLIEQSTRKLVMFPEGDVTGRDDEVLPLKKDGIRNMLTAQLRLLEKGAGEPVFLLPVAAFYEVMPDAMGPIGNCLARLAEKLHLQLRQGTLEDQIKQVLVATVEHLERYYGVPSVPQLPLDARLRHLTSEVALATAHCTGIHAPDCDQESVLLYSVRGRLSDNSRYAVCDCDYCNRLRMLSLKRAQAHLRDLDCMQQLLIIDSTLKQRPFAMEVAWRLVDRLEYQLTEQSSHKGRRIVWLEAAQPLNLLDYCYQYRQHPEQAVKSIDRSVRAAMGEAMRHLQRRHRLETWPGLTRPSISLNEQDAGKQDSNA